MNNKFSSFFFQVYPAAKRGAVGAILFVDPGSVAKEGTNSSDTYPNAPWMSKDAVFSKSVLEGNGDPLTPHLPSIAGMYRRPRNESNLPSIPAQPISYEDALKLLSRLKGEFCTTSFPGSLKFENIRDPGSEVGFCIVFQQAIACFIFTFSLRYKLCKKFLI